MDTAPGAHVGWTVARNTEHLAIQGADVLHKLAHLWVGVLEVRAVQEKPRSAVLNVLASTQNWQEV